MASCPSECKVLRIMVLGRSGVGKSATANAILGTETFKETETIQCEIQSGRVEGRNISVIDTPGINNTSLTPEQWRTELKKGLLLSSPGPHVFLLVTKVGKFSEEERNAVKWIVENFGEEARKFTMILFIGREEMTQRQLVKFSEDVRTKDLISCFQGGYCVINSKREVNQAQISKLLEEIEAIVQQNGGQVYTQEMYEAVDRMRAGGKTQKKEEMGKGHENQPKPNQDTSLEVQKVDSVVGVNVKCRNVIPPKKQEESVKSLPERKGKTAAKFVQRNPSTARRIVLLGKSGSGKSATGNTILNGNYFEAKPSPVLVTRQCEVKISEHITVIDTPGMFNTRLTPDEFRQQMDRCMKLSAPGPHVFLLVIKLGRLTEEEKKTVKWMKENFGQYVFRFTMILFTHTDQLGENTLDDILAESADLRQLLNCCGNRYHAFNNNDPSPSQVENLMQKINNMVMLNNSRYYTEELYHAQGNGGGDETLDVGLAVAAGVIAAAGLAVLGFLLTK